MQIPMYIKLSQNIISDSVKLINNLYGPINQIETKTVKKKKIIFNLDLTFLNKIKKPNPITKIADNNGNACIKAISS